MQQDLFEYGVETDASFVCVPAGATCAPVGCLDTTDAGEATDAAIATDGAVCAPGEITCRTDECGTNVTVCYSGDACPPDPCTMR